MSHTYLVWWSLDIWMPTVCRATCAVWWVMLSPSFSLFFRSHIRPCAPHPRQCWEEWWQALLFLPRESLRDGPESHDPVQDRAHLPGEFSHQSANLMLIIPRERFISLCNGWSQPVSSSLRQAKRKSPMITSNCWAGKIKTHQLPVRKQNLCCLPQKLALGSILLFLFLWIKCLSSRVYFSPHLYTCTDIHTKPELCLLGDVLLWPGVLFFTRRPNNDTVSKTLKSSLHGLHRSVSQDAPVFARCVPKVCHLQEI